MKTLISATLFLFLVSAVYAGDSRKAVPREWSDNTGTFRVTAKLVDFDPDTRTVRLKDGNGKTVDLPMRRLSTADQNYVNSQAALSADANKLPRVQNIAGIKWIQSREDASRAALGRASVNDDKPIMCFRALGDLNGFM